MVTKLSTFLNSNLSEGLDSGGVTTLVNSGNTSIPIDSGTTGNFVKELAAGNGISLSGNAAHSATVTVTADSSQVAFLSSTQTLTNKTINLSNNTLSTTLSQLNSAISGNSVLSASGEETATNKTLTAPIINLSGSNISGTAGITGPGAITQISTFGLRDTTATTYDTRLASTSSTSLTANRTLTFDVKNVDRTISLTGNLSLGGNFTTSGAHATTITTTGTTAVTLPTSGTLISKDGSNNVSSLGTVTATTFSGSGASLTNLPAGQLTGTIDSARLPDLATSDITSGTFDSARIPVMSIGAGNITSGTIDSARIPIMSIGAGNITSGTISDDRLPSSISSDITGNAATATALETARNIGGVSFDGTGNINLPGVNTAGNQNTSGTAALATEVTATANNSTNETVYLTFVDGATGSQGIETDTGLSYNPSSGIVTATAFAGDGSALTGLPASGLDSALVLQLIDSDYVNLTAGVSTTRSNFVVGTAAGSYNGSTTDFPVTYTVGLVDVYLNGIKMVVGTDVTATNGTSVVLASAADIGMTVEVVAYQSFGVANHYTQTAADSRFVNVTGDTMTGNLDFDDNVIARFGNGNDLQVYHTGSSSNIKENGTGNLNIWGDDIVFYNSAGSEVKGKLLSNGATELYHDNVKGINTTSGGAEVTGTLDVSGVVTGPTTDTLLVINSSGTTVKTIRGV